MSVMDELEAKEAIEEHLESVKEEKPFLPTWGYICVFTLPAILTFAVLNLGTGFDPVFSAVIALAVMNGSINSIIAILTIRLDGHSQEALDHLDMIIDGMETFEETLDEANSKVTSFTDDLEDAKTMFTKVGVDLTELELEPIADVVEKLKENKGGLNEILDNLKDVDVTAYITQAKGIDWKSLLDAAEELMTFVKSKNINYAAMNPSTQMPKLPDLDERFDAVYEEDDEEFFDDEEDYEEPIDLELNRIQNEGATSIEDLMRLAQPPKKKKLDLAPPKKE